MCDFGMSAFWRQTPQPTPTNGVGHGVHGHGHGKTVDTVDPAAPPSGLSVLWAAPELFAASGRATFATDVYAFGVVLWEICSLAQPFGDLRTDMVPAVVLRGGRPDLAKVRRDKRRAETVPPELLELAARCWRHDPARRPAMGEVLRVIQRLRRQAGANACPAAPGAAVAAAPRGAGGGGGGGDSGAAAGAAAAAAAPRAENGGPAAAAATGKKGYSYPQALAAFVGVCKGGSRDDSAGPAGRFSSKKGGRRRGRAFRSLPAVLDSIPENMPLTLRSTY